MSVTVQKNGQVNSTPPQPVPVSNKLPRTRRVLLVEATDLECQKLQQRLQEDPLLQVDTASDGAEALKSLGKHTYSILITDLRTPSLGGLHLIKEIQQRRLPVTVIVTAEQSSIDEVVQAMQLGTYDFLTKPINVENLRRVIHRALKVRVRQDELAQLREELHLNYSFCNILSKNPQMHAVFELISNVAHTNSTVLIEGETGTGKEQVARAIHEASQARTGPLVAVNCAALPETLLESELFGHEKGAFTSAVGQRKGRFELANGGTLFLDEVGDVPATMQAKLLRVLQERRFERVGSPHTIEVDVRVIAATNRSLQKLVRQGTFREDLFYRLNVVKIELPPLRDRPEDIPLLARLFTERYARPGESAKEIAADAMALLINHRWPGNIRELENAIERACVTSPDSVIRLANLPVEVSNPTADKLPFRIDIDTPLPELLSQAIASIEQKYLRKAMKKTHGHVGRCASISGLSRRSITAKLAEYRLDKKQFQET